MYAVLGPWCTSEEHQNSHEESNEDYKGKKERSCNSNEDKSDERERANDHDARAHYS